MKHRRPKQPKIGQAASPERPDIELSCGLYGLKLVHSFEGAPLGTVSIDWSTDGTMLAAVGAEGLLAIWPGLLAARPRLMNDRHESQDVSALSWHPTRPTLATASEDGTVRLWSGDWKHSRRLIETDLELMGVAWSPDGRRLAVTDHKGGLSIWDAENGARLH